MSLPRYVWACVCTGLMSETEFDALVNPEADMWKFLPETDESPDDSTEGKGSGSISGSTSRGGGVRARVNGDAAYPAG